MPFPEQCVPEEVVKVLFKGSFPFSMRAPTWYHNQNSVFVWVLPRPVLCHIRPTCGLSLVSSGLLQIHLSLWYLYFSWPLTLSCKICFIIIQMWWGQQIKRGFPLQTEFITQRSWEEGAYHSVQGHMGEAPGLGGGQRVQGENVGSNLYCGFLR